MGFADREGKRKTTGVAAAMIAGQPEKPKQATNYGRPKVERETKKRYNVMLLPSVYEKMKKIAYVERRSISDIISECIEAYIEQNANKLKQYDKLKKD